MTLIFLMRTYNINVLGRRRFLRFYKEMKATKGLVCKLLIVNNSGVRNKEIDLVHADAEVHKDNERFIEFLTEAEAKIIYEENLASYQSDQLVTYLRVHGVQFQELYKLELNEFKTIYNETASIGTSRAFYLDRVLPIKMNPYRVNRTVYPFYVEDEEPFHNYRYLHEFFYNHPLQIAFPPKSRKLVPKRIRNKLGVMHDIVEWEDYLPVAEVLIIDRLVPDMFVADALYSGITPMLIDIQMRNICIDKLNTIETGKYFYSSVYSSWLKVKATEDDVKKSLIQSQFSKVDLKFKKSILKWI